VSRRQLAVTLVADVTPGREASLDALLRRMGADPGGNAEIPFGKLTTTHFARLLALGEGADLDERPLPAKLLYLSDIDEPLDRHVDELLTHGGAGLDRVFSHCDGYPGGRRAPSRAARRAWLEEHFVDADAVYVNTLGRTLEDVRREDALREAIVAFLDDPANDWSDMRPERIRAAVQDHVNTRPELEWAQRPPDGPGAAELARRLAGLAGLPLALLALAPLAVPVLPLWFAGLLAHELTDDATHVRPSDAHVRALAELEDRISHNQFSAVGMLKRGLLRRVTADVLLRLLDYGTSNLFNQGDLTGVRTIHFARWVFIDGRRRLLFASNYDGSLESYMDDFIDKVAWGLNAVFSNGYGYPRTTALIFGGAKREQEFKDFLRRHQVPTQVWYSAYPHLTAANIANNARVREGLHGELSAAECERWLART
jgi:hypothetical protein